MKSFNTYSIKIILSCLAFALTFGENAFAVECSREKSTQDKAEISLKKVNRLLSRTELQLSRANTQLERSNTQRVEITKEIDSLRTEILGLSPSCTTAISNSNCRKSKRLERKVKNLESRLARLAKVIIRKEKVASDLKTKNNENLELVKAAQTQLDAAKLSYSNCVNTPSDDTANSRVYRYDFNSLALNSNYAIGKTFGDNYLRFQVSPFKYNTGTESSGDFANATVNLYSRYFTSLSSNDIGLWVGNVNVKIQTANIECAKKVSFDYLNGGGTVNLSVNGNQVLGRNLSDFSNSTVGDGLIVNKPTDQFGSNSNSFQNKGRLEITGNCIKEIQVGGQEFLLDNVAFELPVLR